MMEEKKLFKNGYKYISGVDEVGRGSLAGPVVAACVVIDSHFLKIKKEIKSINDSKQISSKIRKELYNIINKHSLSVSIGICFENIIDKINILQASLLASQVAVNNANNKIDIVLMDGSYKIPEINLEQKTIIKGDAKIATIAAASIIAKVYRDKIMTEIDSKYPQYNFKENKGYGSAYHRKKIHEIGPCKIHRKSFSPMKNL